MYARRKAMVEQGFGQMHTLQGRHVLLRRLVKASREWELMAGCHNLLLLFMNRAQTVWKGREAAHGGVWHDRLSNASEHPDGDFLN